MGNIFDTRLAWMIYKQTEKQFLDFTEFVPLEKQNDKLYSPKLLMIMLQIGSNIETVFKSMVDYSNLNFESNIRDPLTEAKKAIENGKADITHYRKLFEPYYDLSSHEVTIMYGSTVYDTVKPFDNFKSNKSPDWWKDYTDLKHGWYTNLAKANLYNTVRSLAGLFLLNVIHVENRRTLVYLDVIKSGNLLKGIINRIPKTHLISCLVKDPKYIKLDSEDSDVFAETSLFFFKFRSARDVVF